MIPCEVCGKYAEFLDASGELHHYFCKEHFLEWKRLKEQRENEIEIPPERLAILDD